MDTLIKYIDTVKNFTNKRSERSIVLSKSIFSSFGIRLLSIVIQFYLVRLSLHYVSGEQYGIWLTLFNLFTWVTLLDFGFSNGLRNQLTKAVSDQDRERAAGFISTTYAILLLIFGGVYLVCFLVAPYVSWQAVFNTRLVPESDLLRVVQLSLGLFCLRFVLALLNSVLLALHRAAVVELLNTLSLLLTVALLVVFIQFSEKSLFRVALAYNLPPVLVFLVASVYLYRTELHFVKPSTRFIEWKNMKTVAGTGNKFFVIQVVSVIMVSSQSILISHLFSPRDVAVYNVVVKYYSVITMIIALVTMPSWSFVADAFHKKDFVWLRSIARRMIYIWCGLAGVALVMTLAAGWFLPLWLGQGFSQTSLPLVALVALYTLSIAWGNIFSLLLNGLGLITVQMLVGLVVMVVTFPLTIGVVRYLGLGLEGIPFAFILCLLPGMILQPYQYYKVITNKAKGVWAR